MRDAEDVIVMVVSGFPFPVHSQLAASFSSEMSAWITSVGTVTTAAAVILGGMWAYLKFIRERPYNPRLEVAMSSQWLALPSGRALRARVTVKNIGAVSVHLRQRGTGLRVSKFGKQVSAPSVVEWTMIKVFPIFLKHEWIEPSESVTDDMLLVLDIPEGEPVLFETRLVWIYSGGDHNIVVNARQVMPADSKVPSVADK